MTTDGVEERQQIDMVIDRIAASRELPRERVAGVVDKAYRELEQNRIRDFVPLLVERRALRDLDRTPID
ncbi:three-helix bundle dimerization domain-containing protein [Williamsia sp. MIQD14]|uniref:three-helix bundle dimerization domain-containing protein n=1 Tax=Williamsia sp. MIQD14 TaxID=3425703 RepID=UPI003DA0A89C